MCRPPPRPTRSVPLFPFTPLFRSLDGLLAILGAAPAGAVSLEQAVRSALKTSPDVGIVLENRRATNEELEQAEGRFLPTLDLRTTGGFESTDDVTTRGRANDPNAGS